MVEWGASPESCVLKVSTESLSEDLSTQPLSLVSLRKPACLAWADTPITELHNQPPEACKSRCSLSRELFPPLLLYKEIFIESRPEPQECPG